MESARLRVALVATLGILLGGACTEPQAPTQEASAAVPAFLSSQLDGSLQVTWASPEPPWFSGYRFTDDPFSAADGSVTIGSVLGSYLGHVESSYDADLSVPVDVRFGSSQFAYRLVRNG